MPRASQLGGFDLIGLLPLLLVVAAVVVPLLFVRRSSPPGPLDDDDDSGDGGGGGGSGPPGAGPAGRPSGGIPLPDAAQARVRLRGGHARLAERAGRRERRPAHQPERAPATAPR
jgi:hypothetical protein